MQKCAKKENNLVPRTPGTKAPRSQDQTGQDLETLKVPWSRGPVVPGLKKSKSPGTENGKSPGENANTNAYTHTLKVRPNLTQT